jgi:hypothetical protein
VQGAQQFSIAPNIVPNYTFSKGILIFTHKIYIGSATDLKNRVMESLYNSELEGHLGEKQHTIGLNYCSIGLV